MIAFSFSYFGVIVELIETDDTASESFFELLLRVNHFLKLLVIQFHNPLFFFFTHSLIPPSLDLLI